jgi:azobenzene reductase
MNVLVLSSSLQPLSRTLLTAAMVAEVLRRDGAEVTVWDLAARPLPFADPAYHADPRNHPDSVVGELVKTADMADAFLLATPIYHNSYSGVLKNALDHLSIRQFHHKPVGLIAFGGSMTAVQACDHLRIVVRGLMGVAVPTQLVATPADFGTGPQGRPRVASPELLRRARRMAQELKLFAGLASVPADAGVKPGIEQAKERRLA